MTPILNLENISYKYKHSQRSAVADISYTFEEGTVYAIVGPSGSGKSTLLSLLAGLDAPTEGRICFQGTDLARMDLDRYRRERISMIFQAFHLFPLLTVLENVYFPMELCKVTPRDAKLILGDEPTENLDSANTQNIIDILCGLAHEKRYCILIVTHDIHRHLHLLFPQLSWGIDTVSFTIKSFFLHTLVLTLTASNTNLSSYNGKNLLVICNIINLKNVTGAIKEIFKKRGFPNLSELVCQLF